MEQPVLLLVWQPICLLIITEVIDGTLAYMDNNDIEIDELINHIKAPDFPTEVLFMVMKVFVKHSKLEEEEW
jgi:hypothetical protein